MIRTGIEPVGMESGGAFAQIVEMVVSRSGLQKKKILADLASRDQEFFSEAEAFAVSYGGYLEQQGIPLAYAVEAYLEMCRNMMKCQIEFMKTGCYTVAEHLQAFEQVYDNPEKMKSYMIGLAISQFLWRTHYEMYRCLRDAVARYCPTAHSYLEIGPGHGLFLREAMSVLSPDAAIMAVDISPVSIGITRSIMEYFFPEAVPPEYHTGDMLLLESVGRYDFITMGEVLEHVNYPDLLLRKLHGLLADDGRAFVSTCVNAPAIDHVYHFGHIDEIRCLLDACGLEIEEERVLPVEALPMSEIVELKITINYCAILKRKRL
jgi:SAM-dependent methyltransferase